MNQIDRAEVAPDATGNDILGGLSGPEGASQAREQIRDVVHEVLAEMIHRSRRSRRVIPSEVGRSCPRDVRQVASFEEREP